MLDVRLPYDELQLLRDNIPYLLRSLKLESMAVHPITDKEVCCTHAHTYTQHGYGGERVPRRFCHKCLHACGFACLQN